MSHMPRQHTWRRQTCTTTRPAHPGLPRCLYCHHCSPFPPADEHYYPPSPAPPPAASSFTPEYGNFFQRQAYAVPANMSDPYLREWTKAGSNPFLTQVGGPA